MTTNTKSQKKISALSMSAIVEAQVTDVTGGVQYYIDRWNQITTDRETVEREVIKELKARADIAYGELLVALEKESSDVQQEFVSSKGLTKDLVNDLKSGYRTWSAAQSVLSEEQKARFFLVGYTTKARVARLPDSRQEEAIIALADGALTDKALRAELAKPEVKLERATTEAGAASCREKQASTRFKAVQKDPTITATSATYKAAEAEARHAAESLKALEVKIAKLEKEVADKAAAESAAKEAEKRALAAEARAKKAKEESLAESVRIMEELSDLQRRVATGDYDEEGATTFFIGANAIYLTMGGALNLFHEMETYMMHAEKYCPETRAKIDITLLRIRDRLNEFYKQD